MSDLEDPRVLFAAERTLLAWNRTSLALIAFGFLIERSGLLIHAFTPGDTLPPQLTSAFWIGIAFILFGAITAVYSARQFLAVLRTLKQTEIPDGYTVKWGPFVNWVVALLGAALVIVLYIGRV